MAHLAAVVASTWSAQACRPADFLPPWHADAAAPPGVGAGEQTPEQMLAIARQISGMR